jgi:dihydrofolate reductase
MRKLVVFNQATLDGYFTDRNGDMSWAHKDDAEWNAFVADNAKGGGVLLFGRITYELMASFWPTAPAMKSLAQEGLIDGPSAMGMSCCATSRARESKRCKSRSFDSKV